MPPRSPRTRPVDEHIIFQDAIDPIGTVRIATEVSMTPRFKTLRGTSNTLDIPLDEPALTRRQREDERLRDEKVAGTGPVDAQDPETQTATVRPPRELRRRDSLKRREALLKGKEGSRRRQKWENDRLIGNPWAEPPEPRDWEPRPTYQLQTVPYFLAPLWDERKARVQLRAMDSAKKAEETRRQQTGNVPKDLREKLKRAKGAKNLLQDLEEQVREFVRLWDEREATLRKDGLEDMDSSEDEEIVFVGRNGQASRSVAESKSREARLAREKMIFDSLVGDNGAAFGRWLVHAIGSYYELDTWSKTIGNPARREAYVGIAEGCRYVSGSDLPAPLWGLV